MYIQLRGEIFMKKFYLLAAGLTLSLTLGACANHQSKTATSSTTSQSQRSSQGKKANQASAPKVQTQAKASHTQATKATWNETKSKQLATFMTNWGASMNQSYDAYTPDKPGDFYGASIPNATYNGQMPLAIDSVDNQVKVAWAPNGNGPKDTYLLLACYSDTAHARYLGKHVYLFASYNNQPQVLVSQQNQGNERNSFVFKQTANQDLAKGFAQIFAGKNIPAKFDKSSANNSNKQGLAVSNEEALKLFYTVQTSAGGNAEFSQRLANDADSYLFTDISGQNVTFGMGKDVTRTFPTNTYQVLGSPSYLGSTVFQKIGPNKYLVYQVPSHFDLQFQEDASFAKQKSDQYMDHPQEVTVGTVDEQVLAQMKAKLTH